MINVKFTQAGSPLTCVEEENDIIQVSGFAVHTGTFNDITIELDELYKSVDSLVGKPLLTNHRGSTETVVGKITSAKMAVDPTNGKHGIAYTADVDAKEEDLVRKIKLGFLDSTSVGFMCDHICSICGSDIWKCAHWFDDEGFQILAKNIKFHELSIVAIPADSDASVKVNLSVEDKKHFEELKLKKQELRRTNMSDLEQKYNNVVDEFNQFKLTAADNARKAEEEFAAKKSQLESEKADKIEENLALKNELETLKKEKKDLEAKVAEFKEKFDQIENERLSALRAKVTELSKKVNAGLSDKEISELDEGMLQRYEGIFSNQLETMTKVVPNPNHIGGQEQYQAPIDENAPQTEQFLAKLKHFRGF